ncbi:MAG: hypothetical protein KKE05_00425 [Nanoarchaeota archaeon]|nr:hypothetical protein [Nanoarchaeota archaeon]
MRIIEFNGCNTIYAEHQPEYLPLPAHKTEDGLVTSCWGLSWLERLKILFTGKMWLSVLTFNKPLQPLMMSVDSLIQPPLP